MPAINLKNFYAWYNQNESMEISHKKAEELRANKRYKQEQDGNTGQVKPLQLEPKKWEEKRPDVDAFLETVR